MQKKGTDSSAPFFFDLSAMNHKGCFQNTQTDSL